jgi:hypothetical protein
MLPCSGKLFRHFHFGEYKLHRCLLLGGEAKVKSILDSPDSLTVSIMRSSIIFQLLFSFAAVNALTAHPRSTVNGPCTGKDGRTGVCIAKSSCDGTGESWINNACPGTPDDIKCCTKPSCQQAGRSGDCRWEDKCGAGSETLTGLCPGPSAFKCCVPRNDDPGSGSDLGKKILKKAKEAEGTPCKSAVKRMTCL